MSTENNKDCDLSNVVLQVSGENIEGQDASRPERRPKRVLYFSDGELAEYSDDEPDSAPPPPQAIVDLKTLGWIPWTWYQTTWVSSKLLGACDFVGESLADFLGITSPKYHFEIAEYQRIKRQQAEEKHKSDQEMNSWNGQPSTTMVMNDVKTTE